MKNITIFDIGKSRVSVPHDSVDIPSIPVPIPSPAYNAAPQKEDVQGNQDLDVGPADDRILSIPGQDEDFHGMTWAESSWLIHQPISYVYIYTYIYYVYYIYIMYVLYICIYITV